MQNYLIFKLYGPMVSWGKIAVGESRHSDNYPSKSGLLGLIAAAMGIRRTEEEKLQALQETLGFAVRVDQEGVLIRDYHTTQVPSKRNLKNRPHMTRRDELLVPELQTVLSTREYYCDALYTVVLWQRTSHNAISLSLIQKALVRPVFVLYLGRKSCPLGLPVKAIITSKNTILDALDFFDTETADVFGCLEFLNKKLITRKPLSLYWDKDGNVGEKINSMKFIRKDSLKNRGRWQYQDREEYYQLILSKGNT